MGSAQKDANLAATDNLMDYGTGTTLTKAQWDALHSEYRRLTWFQGSEEGKDVIKVNLKKLVDGLKAGRSSTEKRFTYTENDYLTLIQDAATFVTKTYEPVRLGDGTSLNLAVEFTAKSGQVDLSLSEDGVYNSIGISIDLKEKYHTQFNVRFYNQQKELLFKIWATSYEDFTAFLSYVGWNLTPKSRGKVVELYRNATNQAKDDPDKLDVIFETAPPFVLESFSDAEKWLFIRLLNGNSKDQVGTDEYKALVNLLSSLSPQSLFTQNEQDASLLAVITQHCPDRSLSSLLYAFTHAGSKIWSDALLNAAGYTYTYKKEVGRSLPENFVGDPSKWYVLGGGAGASSNAGFSTTYELGVDAIEYDNEKSLVANKSAEVSRKRYAFYDPVLVNVTDEFSLMVPAFAAYQLVKSSIGKERNEMLNFGLTVLLPEVNLKAFRAQGRVFREHVVNNASRYVAKSGKELEVFLLKLTKKPVGKSYVGDLFRSLSKESEVLYNSAPKKITPFDEYSSWGRYDLEGAENAMYLSKTEMGNKTEILEYGQWTDYNTYKFENVNITNLLDLTDDAVRQQLGTQFDDLVKTLGTKKDNYDIPNTISSWTRKNGYNGIIVPGSRGAKDYENIILFEQYYVDKIFINVTPKLIRK